MDKNILETLKKNGYIKCSDGSIKFNELEKLLIKNNYECTLIDCYGKHQEHGAAYFSPRDYIEEITVYYNFIKNGDRDSWVADDVTLIEYEKKD